MMMISVCRDNTLINTAPELLKVSFFFIKQRAEFYELQICRFLQILRDDRTK